MVKIRVRFPLPALVAELNSVEFNSVFLCWITFIVFLLIDLFCLFEVLDVFQEFFEILRIDFKSDLKFVGDFVLTINDEFIDFGDHGVLVPR